MDLLEHAPPLLVMCVQGEENGGTLKRGGYKIQHEPSLLGPFLSVTSPM